MVRGIVVLLLAALPAGALAQRTQKPPLHGQEWMAVTGKPLGAAAGAKVFLKGGNAVDAACAMIAATATMWDVLHWGGETQALVWNPHARKVTGVNALGVAPAGATAEFFRSKGMDHPPPYGPLAAVTPGTPGGIMTMLAEWGRLSLSGGPDGCASGPSACPATRPRRPRAPGRRSPTSRRDGVPRSRGRAGGSAGRARNS